MSRATELEAARICRQTEDMNSEVRIDKWLWAARLYKTRALATEACRGGHVRIGGSHVKPSREVRPGDIVAVRLADITRTVKVLNPVEKRVGPKMVPEIAEDLTPAEEYLRQLEVRRDATAAPRRARGAGRPTKKERRQLQNLGDIP